MANTLERNNMRLLIKLLSSLTILIALSGDPSSILIFWDEPEFPKELI